MNRAHLVRPRRVWSGLALGLLGVGLFALWTATWRPAAGIAGVALMLLGAGVAWRGGILYDTRGSHDPHGSPGASQELADLAHNRVHRGTAPGDMVIDPRLRAEAAATNRRTAALIRASEATPRPTFDTAAAALLLGAAIALVAIQGVYPHTTTGQSNGLRSLLLAVVIALSALRLLVGQRPGRAPSAIAGLCGVVLIARALLVDHDRPVTVGLEIGIGAWVVLMALLSLDRPPRVERARQDTAAHAPRGPRRARTWPENVRIMVVSLLIGATALAVGGLARRLSALIGRTTR